MISALCKLDIVTPENRDHANSPMIQEFLAVNARVA